MVDQMYYLKQELVQLVMRHADKEGSHKTEIQSLSYSRHSVPHGSSGIEAPYKINRPSIYIMVQGIKDVIIGEEHIRYGPPDYLVASMNLPVIAEVPEASVEVPSLSLKIEFTHSQILELLIEEELENNSRKKPKRGLNIAELDESKLDAVVRLVRLLDQPADIPVLAPLFIKEILYKVLRSEHGDSLKQVVKEGSPTIYIQNVIQHIINHYQNSFHVEELANIAKMSVPSFYRHFKEVTAMSPIQFQKQIRLQEARRLLISNAKDVAEIAFYVGYESPTQFIREYSRMFGFSPRKDANRIHSLNDHKATE